jgi:hypothetical protein
MVLLHRFSSVLLFRHNRNPVWLLPSRNQLDRNPVKTPPSTFYSTISQEEGEKKFGAFIQRKDKELPFRKERVNC